MKFIPSLSGLRSSHLLQGGSLLTPTPGPPEAAFCQDSRPSHSLLRGGGWAAPLPLQTIPLSLKTNCSSPVPQLTPLKKGVSCLICRAPSPFTSPPGWDPSFPRQPLYCRAFCSLPLKCFSRLSGKSISTQGPKQMPPATAPLQPSEPDDHGCLLGSTRLSWGHLDVLGMPPCVEAGVTMPDHT